MTANTNWRVLEGTYRQSPIPVYAGDTRIASVGDLTKTPFEDRERHARLIAAAPEMLSALKVAQAFIESLPYEPSISPSTAAQDAIVDAIAKAEGR